MAAVSGNPAVALRDRAREAMLASGGRGFVRFLPPLTISDEEIEKGLTIYKKVLDAFAKQ